MRSDISKLTNVVDTAARLGLGVVQKAKKDFGGLDFGERKPTRAEREKEYRMYKSLTLEEMDSLTQMFGEETVNSYISNMKKGRRYA